MFTPIFIKISNCLLVTKCWNHTAWTNKVIVTQHEVVRFNSHWKTLHIGGGKQQIGYILLFFISVIDALWYQLGQATPSSSRRRVQLNETFRDINLFNLFTNTIHDAFQEFICQIKIITDLRVESIAHPQHSSALKHILLPNAS